MGVIQKGVVQRISSSGSAGSFTDITSGTNATAAMVVGTGASLTTSGSGTIVATTITSRTIGGVAYDGSANITVASATAGFAVSGGNLTVAGTEAITSASAAAFSVGLNGATNPSFNVDNSTALQVAGASVRGAVTGGTVLISATDSGLNAGISLASKGTSAANLVGGSTSTLQVSTGTYLTGSSSNVTFTNVQRNSTANVAHLFTGIASGTAGTSLTAGSEVNSFFANYAAIQTHGSNTAITLQRDIRITGSTHAFQTATGTITDAAALAIAGAPIAGTNCAITNGSTIYSAGSAVGAGTTNSYGLNITANTGATNNHAAIFNGNVLVTTGGLRPGTFTVATLPVAPPTGSIAVVTDQLTTANAKGIAPTGGGAVVCAQIYTGAAWVGI